MNDPITRAMEEGQFDDWTTINSLTRDYNLGCPAASMYMRLLDVEAEIRALK